jgi:hypothetical protein
VLLQGDRSWTMFKPISSDRTHSLICLLSSSPQRPPKTEGGATTLDDWQKLLNSVQGFPFFICSYHLHYRAILDAHTSPLLFTPSNLIKFVPYYAGWTFPAPQLS